ncbi:MAG: hypothetical protein RTU30_05745 [Candidatus Thorarchaeota archaeon]
MPQDEQVPKSTSSSFSLKTYKHALHLNLVGLDGSLGTVGIPFFLAASIIFIGCPDMSGITADLSNRKDLPIVTI